MIKLTAQVRRLLRDALREDIGEGDLTTDLLVPKDRLGESVIEAKERGILCGGPFIKEVFQTVDPRLQVKQLVSEGATFSEERKVFIIRGPIASILKGERVALNFLGRLSGIAILTRQFVLQTKGTRAKIFDTRKTTPLWRELEKYAVRTGGGQNHRFGLWDEILVKDNHWAAILPSLRPAKGRARQGDKAISGLLWQHLERCLAMTSRRKVPIELEVDNLKQLEHLLSGDVHPSRVLLDNFSVDQLKRAVRMVRNISSKIELEASGGITLRNVRKVAKTGVDRISVGALTHSAPALDFSLKVTRFFPKSKRGLPPFGKSL